MTLRRSASALAVLLAAAARAEPPPALAPAPVRDAPSRVVLVAGPERPIARGALVSLSVKDADLVEVVRSFARIGGFNLVLDPSVRGTVTAELADVPWERALAVILKTNGLAMEIDGRVIAIAAPARLYRWE